MKITHLFIGSFLLMSFLFSWRFNSTPKTSTVFFCEGSSLKIKGSSNVNKFECVLDMNTLSDELLVSYNDSEDYLNFTNANLIIPAKHFDCGGKMINKDFQKLLNTDEFPEIRLVLKKVMKSNITEDCTEAIVDVLICGIKNTYSVPITTSKSIEGNNINGVLALNINDFSLEPPKKMLGVIKVSPVIEIDFLLNFKVD